MTTKRVDSVTTGRTRSRGRLFCLGLAFVLALAGCGPAGKAAAKKAAPKLAEFAVSYLANEALHEHEQRHAAEKRQTSRAQKIQVTPAAGTVPAWDPQTQLWYQPNNVGGNLYWFPDGQASGFTAFHLPSRQTHHFDPSGRRLR